MAIIKTSTKFLNKKYVGYLTYNHSVIYGNIRELEGKLEHAKQSFCDADEDSIKQQLDKIEKKYKLNS